MAKEYVPKVWENYKTPILDEDLNHIEKGLKEVTDGLNSEIQNRKSESNAFKNDLRSESNVREETDNSLAEMISSEATARVASVEKESEDRKNGIREEAQERTNADNAIKESLASEKSSRENADSTLQRNIENEKSARETADNAINESLASHGTRLNALETYTVKVDSEGYIGYTYNGE